MLVVGHQGESEGDALRDDQQIVTADLVPRTFESSAQLAENAFNGRFDSKYFGRSKDGIELRGQPIGVALYAALTAA